MHLFFGAIPGIFEPEHRTSPVGINLVFDFCPLIVSAGQETTFHPHQRISRVRHYPTHPESDSLYKAQSQPRH